mgnify:CR=1 FL=1
MSGGIEKWQIFEKTLNKKSIKQTTHTMSPIYIIHTPPNAFITPGRAKMLRGTREVPGWL